MVERLHVNLSYVHNVGSNYAYIKNDGSMIVEFYHFGEDVAYEYADELTFSVKAQIALATALGSSETAPKSQALLDIIAQRFTSCGEVERFAQDHNVPFNKFVDMRP